MREKSLPKINGESLPKANLITKKDAAERDKLSKERLNWALLVAARNGWTYDVKDLMKSGADLEARDSIGMTPLMWAASKDRFHICIMLIEMGANLEAKDKSGFTPLMHAANEGHDVVCSRLISKGADVNVRNNHESTALMLAAGRGSWGVCGLLVENGADFNAKDNNGWPAAMRAKHNGHEGLRMYLMIVSLMGSNEKRVEFTSYLQGCISLQKR